MDEDTPPDIPDTPSALEALEQRFAGMCVVTSKWMPPDTALIIPDSVADEANRRGCGLEDLES